MQMLTMKGASKKHRGVAQVQGASKKGRHLMVVIPSQQPVGNSTKISGRTEFTCFSPPKNKVWNSTKIAIPTILDIKMS